MSGDWESLGFDWDEGKMPVKWIKVLLTVISVGIGGWLVYGLALSGFEAHKIVFLVYIMLVVATLALMPGQTRIRELETSKKGPDKPNPEEVILNYYPADWEGQKA